MSRPMNLQAEMKAAETRADARRRMAALVGAQPYAHPQAGLFFLFDAAKERSEGPARPATVKHINEAFEDLSKRVVESRTALLLQALSDKPGMPIPTLAKRVYGDESDKSKAKTRSLIAALKRRKAIHRISSGRWEVVKRNGPTPNGMGP